MRRKTYLKLLAVTIGTIMLIGCGQNTTVVNEEASPAEEIPQMQNATATTYSDMEGEEVLGVEKVRISQRTNPEVNRNNGFVLVDANGNEIFPSGDAGSYFTVKGAIAYTDDVASQAQQEGQFTGGETVEEASGVAVIGD